MNMADVGAGLKAVREGHRYCTGKDHGGHDFEDCPLLRHFMAIAEREPLERIAREADETRRLRTLGLAVGAVEPTEPEVVA